MSKTVKVIAGAALIYFSAGLATAAVAGWGAGAAYLGGLTALISGAITLVGASLMGSALAPDMPDIGSSDSYAGQALQTRKDNTSAVPQAFGELRLGSHIIWQETGSQVAGTPNKDYWSIQVMCEGEIEAFMEMYANEDTMTSKGSNVFTTTYAHIKGYTTSGASGMALNDVSFAKASDGSTQTGSSLGLTNFTIPANVAFLAIHQTYDATDNKHTQLDNITAKIQAKKVEAITSSGFGSVAYSSNPAEIIANLLTSELSVADADIDFVSFDNVRAKCITYGYSCNTAFISQSNIQSAIESVLATCRGQIVYSQGKWKLKIDEKSQTISKVLTEDDVLNKSLTISMKGFQEIANKIDLKYINPSDNWLSAKVEIEDTDLISYDGQEIIKTLDVKGVTSTAQADKLAEITLNSMRYTEDASGNRIKQTPLAIGFATTIKNAELEVGDVFELEHSLLDRDRKFIILSIESDQSGAIQISSREYCEQHYKNSSGTYLI